MELEPGVREALDEVHALGVQDKLEHLIVLRAGKRVGNVTGNATSVSFANVALEPGDIVVHNHPGSINALSNVDGAQIFWHPLGAMYAISGDESVYKVEIGPRGPISAERYLDITSRLSDEVGLIAQVHSLFADKETVAVLHQAEEKEIGPAHWVNRLMAEAGVIRYSFELADETAAEVAKLDKAIGWEHRPSLVGVRIAK